MFSVIIPTCWRGKELSIMLPLLDMRSTVLEVLLINNNNDAVPSWFTQRKWSKVKVFTPPKNIYVNPAFNLGVSQSQSNQICLMSDDVVFDPNIFDFLVDEVGADVGLIGCDSSNIVLYKDHQPPIKPANNLKLVKTSFPIQPGFAFTMWIHKSNYVPIDERLAIHYGENWLMYACMKMGKQPLKLMNILITACDAATTSSQPEFRKQTEWEAKHDYLIKELLDKHFDKPAK
jgi:glycosyltransferase involved in cell wall biosynthesis